MAKWKYACKTAQGMDLDLKLFSRGMPLKLTKSMSGAGKTSPTQLMLLQDVMEPVQELRILDAVERLKEDVIRIPVMLKNKGVAEGYGMHQIGIYAEDPDAGEILYIVMQSDSAEEIPSAEEMKDFTLEWYLNLSVGNAQEVTVVIDETDVLTTEQADAKYVAKDAASDTEVTFEEPAEKNNIESGETLSTLFGKIKKFFSDLKDVAFSGSYNDLEDKPAIPAAVRVKGAAEPETAYHTGDVSLSPEDIGAPSTEYISGHFVPDYIKTVRKVFNAKGWYRIARSFARHNASCTITLKRFYNHEQPEYQKVQLIAGYTQSKLVPLIAYTEAAGAKLFTKMRLTRAAGAEKDYLEVYYDSQSSNDMRATIEDAIGVLDRDNWEMMDPFIVPETADGLTVVASTDLPYNLDPGNYLQSGGRIPAAGKTGYIAYPSDAYFQVSSNSVTGYIKITLPVSWTNTFIRFTVSIFNMGTGESCDYHISGYNYAGTPAWSNCTAVCVGKAGSVHTNLPVRFGHNGTKCVIGIGEVNTAWTYPVIQVHDVMVGYYRNDFETWKSGWNVAFGTTAIATVSTTVSNTHVAHTEDFLLKTGGTMSGSIITPGNDSMGIIPATNNYGQIGSSDKKYYRMYASTFYGNLEGSATKATQDGNGNNIANTYAKKTDISTGWKYVGVAHCRGGSLNITTESEVKILAYTEDTNGDCEIKACFDVPTRVFGDLNNTLRLYYIPDTGDKITLRDYGSRMDIINSCYNMEVVVYSR